MEDTREFLIMTRINIGIDPKTLTSKHLIAEHREMKRVPNQVKSGRVKVTEIPTFRLGKGHVHFFTTRLGYLLKRYREVYQECLRRGFKVENYESAWISIPDELMKDYTPTEEDRKIVEKRIALRLKVN